MNLSDRLTALSAGLLLASEHLCAGQAYVCQRHINHDKSSSMGLAKRYVALSNR